MTPVQRYLAEEIALDHADGLMTRREALWRLGLLGLGAAAASSLLACAREDRAEQTAPSPAATTPPTEPTTPTPDDLSTTPVEPITFPGPQERVLQGSWAQSAAPRGGVLVVHENRGLNDHIRSVAERFAASGYSALAIDLLSEEGGTASLGDPANATAALGRVPPERFVADMRAGIDELERRLGGSRLAAVGFCFGGGMVWRLLDAGEPRLDAAVPFYGPAPDDPDFSGSTAAVLAIYAEFDDRVNATRAAARTALQRAGLTHEIVTFPGVDHAFFNNTGPRHDATAAAHAYGRVLDWFARHVG
ncbi:MAG TPA: dienelactone hydrolase family protein [Egibacteraceae bacterium]|nr:dienelactone hydrolase family protein [Actinomycetota bacterium]HWB72318.1 dienelactone hydrolase family protein [Egibacteraceae bacterium]